MARKRIFYLITELDVGGAETALFRLVTGLDCQRYEPVVACLTGRGAVAGWLERAGVEVISLGYRGCWDLAGWMRLRRALKRRQPDVLHCFLFHANLAGRIASRGLAIPRVISSVRVEEPRRVHLWLDRLTHRWADMVTCVSRSTCDYVHRTTGVPRDKLVAIPNGIDPNAVRNADTPLPPAWDIPADAPLVGVIGRLHEQKDPLLMLRVVQGVAADVPKVIFAFAGDGPLAERCRVEAKRLRIVRNVRWLGWQADLGPLYARMMLLALASRWEGMPNAILEAMAWSKPVVATAVGGSREAVADGETGFLIEGSDEEAVEALMRRRIVCLLRHEALRRSLSDKARERVVSAFRVDQMVKRNMALYEAEGDGRTSL
jgi:glycosyltransferase involved in cell wall biosynthesis